jgi:transposase
MSVVSIGLDLAKSVFQVHGVDASGHAVLRRKLARGGLIAFFTKQPRCLVAMEACSSAHHWARELVRLGHEVRLIPPQYVKPYVKRNKTDAADAEAICEAAGRPNMRFVPIKTREQQSILVLHRVRALLVRQRTAAVNAARGLLGEFGLVVGKGIRKVDELRQCMDKLEPELLPDEARSAIGCLFDHIDGLGERIGVVEARIIAWHKSSDVSQRLASAPGVGPMTATALVAAVGDGRQFRSARHFAAWLGLTPRIQASGGEERIGRISKGGDRYLRTLLIHGARAIVGTTFRKDIAPRPWLTALIGRRPVNVAATALAHKTARALWAMLTRAEMYRRPSAAVPAAA